MRKRIFTAIFALIGLSSIAVLGSSPDFISNLLDSVQNNPITRAFSTETQKDSEKPIPSNGDKAQGSDDSIRQISLKSDETSPPEVPETVLWPVIFSLPERLDSEAEKARLAGEDDSLWSNYFVRHERRSDEPIFNP
jgi:hypothetical protein